MLIYLCTYAARRYVRTLLFPTPPLPTHTRQPYHLHEAATEGGGASPRENPKANPKCKSEATAVEGPPTVTRLRNSERVQALANLFHFFRRQSLQVPVESVKRPGQKVSRHFGIGRFSVASPGLLYERLAGAVVFRGRVRIVRRQCSFSGGLREGHSRVRSGGGGRSACR